MEERPKKIIFSKTEQKRVFEKAKNFVLKDLLPNPKINKILMFASLVTGTFGKYEKPFRNRIYSDVDILIFVEDYFKIPTEWKPYFSCELYDVFYRIKLYNKIWIQYMVCRKSSYQNKENQKEAEKWGVPLLLTKSKHKYIILYEKKSK
jgi:hypothetical protein